MKFIIRLALLQCLVCGWLCGETIGTKWGGLVEGVSYALESYAKEHYGNLPRDWSELSPILETDLGTVKEEIGRPFSNYVAYFPVNSPTWRQSGMIADGTLVAMTAFVINENRRPTNGRYIVYRRHDGRIGTSWADESKVQAAFAQAGIKLPIPEIVKVRLPLSMWQTELILMSVMLLVAILVLVLGWRFFRAHSAEKQE